VYLEWSHIKPSIIDEWNLTFQYQLSNTASVQVAYIGEKGTGLIVPTWADQKRGASDTKQPYDGTVDLLGNVMSGGYVKGTESTAMMNYNALQAQFRQRMHWGLELTFNYVYSKALSDGGQGFSGIGAMGASSWFQQDYYNIKGEYGRTGMDSRHQITGNLLYKVPVGRGQTYGANMNRVLDEIVGNWKIDAVGSFYTGLPESVYSGFEPYSAKMDAIGVGRAVQLRPFKIKNGKNKNNWFGTDPSMTPCQDNSSNLTADNGICAFAQQPGDAFGNSQTGLLNGPGIVNDDLSITKEFALFKGHKVGFRADIFNVVNVPNYADPDCYVDDWSFGVISGTRNWNSWNGGSRYAQFALRYEF
jgi:hypothetical protein